MKILLPWALSLCLLTGCASSPLPAALPASLVERAETASVSQMAMDSLVLKLFPLEGSTKADLRIDAQADEAAKLLLGSDLERLDPLLPLLVLGSRAAANESSDPISQFQSSLPDTAVLFPESVRCTADGRIFLPREVFEAWASGFGLTTEDAAKELDYDADNDGYLLSGAAGADLDLVLLAALQTAEDPDTLQLDLLTHADGAARRALLRLKKDGSSPLGFTLVGANALDANASTFLYAQPALDLQQEVLYPDLALTVQTGDGLIVEETVQGLYLTLSLPGATQVGSATASDQAQPRSCLYIQMEKNGRARAEDSAYASAAAAQAGYQEKGMELVDLSINSCVFLGINDAYVLRYTALDASGAPAESIEHYIAEGDDHRIYHFVYRYLPGYTQQEMITLLMASQGIRILD